METIDVIRRRMTVRPRRAFRSLRYRLPQPWSNRLAKAVYLPYLRTASVRKYLAEERLIERLATSSEPLRDVGPGLSERVIEVPWVVTRIPSGCPVVLDVGTAFASVAYKRLLLRLDGPRFEIVDLAPLDPSDVAVFERVGIRSHRADVRKLPFAAHSFDVACCVSTVEHVGMDNDLYFGRSDRDEGGDVAALRELSRVITPEGLILVTVPAGEPKDLRGWRQYDVGRFRDTVEEANLSIDALDLFVHDDPGWRPAVPEELSERTYRPGDLSAAAVICAGLVKS